ncbi:MAG: hypothetical protein CW336_01830 [Bacteroidetes bacterium]|nr:hypothetical protein [Bacteroidota bacterium]
MNLLNILLIVLQLATTQHIFNNDSVLNVRIEQVNSENQEIIHFATVLQNRQEIIDQKVDNLVDIIEISNGNINNSLSSTNSLLTIVSIIIASIAAVLAIYVTYLERKIKFMKDIVSTKETEVKSLVDEINNDVYGLFIKIRREDTKAMLQRLVAVPDDISNLIETFLSRNLEKEDFFILKEAYQGLIKKGREKDKPGIDRLSKGEEYLLLFFQHFVGMSVEDDFLEDRIVSYFKTGLNCAFENDIIKVINDLSEVLSNKKTKANRVKVVSELVKAFKVSINTQDHPEYLDMFKNKINDVELWEEVDKINKKGKD